MRKLALTLLILLFLVLTVAFYPRKVDKPMVAGRGDMAVYIQAKYAAPEYHSPLEWWQTHHMDMINRGDLLREDCLYCHQPEESCNNCHNYVGANPIEDTRIGVRP
jgi:hypothetical protein